MAWISDDEPNQSTPVELIQHESQRFTCTEAERAYLNAILDGGLARREVEALREQIAAERLGPEKRRAVVRAWADSKLAAERWSTEIRDVDFGGNGDPLYHMLEKEAEELAESERRK